MSFNPDAEGPLKQAQRGALCYVLTTNKCDLKCDYCGSNSSEHLVPSNIKVHYKKPPRLSEWRRGTSDSLLWRRTFPPWLIEVIEKTDAKHFVIQTNDTLIDKLPRNYWLQMDVILLSIDGVEEVTDKHRGKGVYRKVVGTARRLREMGYKGA